MTVKNLRYTTPQQEWISQEIVDISLPSKISLAKLARNKRNEFERTFGNKRSAQSLQNKARLLAIKLGTEVYVSPSDQAMVISKLKNLENHKEKHPKEELNEIISVKGMAPATFLGNLEHIILSSKENLAAAERLYVQYGGKL